MNTGWICGGGGSNETYAGVIWQLRRVLRVRCRRLHGQEGKGAAHNKRDVTIWSARLKGDGVGGVGATGEAAIGEGCAARSYSGRGRLLSLAVRGGGDPKQRCPSKSRDQRKGYWRGKRCTGLPVKPFPRKEIQQSAPLRHNGSVVDTPGAASPLPPFQCADTVRPGNLAWCRIPLGCVTVAVRWARGRGASARQHASLTRAFRPSTGRNSTVQPWKAEEGIAI